MTAANAVHDASSRSHAVLRLAVRGGGGGGPAAATVSLVDLACSEKASETLARPSPSLPRVISDYHFTVCTHTVQPLYTRFSIILSRFFSSKVTIG